MLLDYLVSYSLRVLVENLMKIVTEDEGWSMLVNVGQVRLMSGATLGRGLIKERFGISGFC